MHFTKAETLSVQIWEKTNQTINNSSEPEAQCHVDRAPAGMTVHCPQPQTSPFSFHLLLPLQSSHLLNPSELHFLTQGKGKKTTTHLKLNQNKITWYK
jgi:hypothetical protein